MIIVYHRAYDYEKEYIEYLIGTPVNYTCSNLARHLDGVSYDAVNDYLY